MWRSSLDHGHERILIEAESLVDLEAGRLEGLFLCRARTLTAIFVHHNADNLDYVLVKAECPEQAIARIEAAICSGMMIRRDFLSSTLGRRATDSA